MTLISNGEHEKKSKTLPKTTLESKNMSLDLKNCSDELNLLMKPKKNYIIKKNIKPDILRIVYNSNALPVLYTKWKAKIVKIGKLQEELDQIHRNQINRVPPPQLPQFH
jgi:hypothetical protein